MSYFGTVTIGLNVRNLPDGLEVGGARILESKELSPEKLLVGKTLEEGKDVLASVYTLCPACQLAAATLAAKTARGALPNAEMRLTAKRLIALEMLSEGLKFFFLTSREFWDCKVPMIKFAGTYKLIQQLTADPLSEENESRFTELEEGVMELLYGKARMEDKIFLRSSKLTADPESIASFLTHLREQKPQGLLPNKIADYRQLLETSGKGFEAFCQASTAPRLQGPSARMERHPIVRHLLETEGNTVYTRLVALFIAMEEIVETLDYPVIELRCESLNEGHGMAVVENLRGLLAHECAFDSNSLIERYEIMTPTDALLDGHLWLGAFAGTTEQTEEELFKTAKLIGLSFNPCVNLDYRVTYA